MNLSFGNKPIYGVAVTPGIGIEVAQIDYVNRVLLNYVSKPFEFDSRITGNNFDLDIFKETLYDALVDVGAKQGSEIVLTLPTTTFRIKDWPASMDAVQITNNIEDEIQETQEFQIEPGEPSYSYCILPNSTIQFNKIAYTALHKSIVMEIAMQIRDLHYKLVAIDTSINSVLNALIYSGRAEVSPDLSWVLLVVDNNCCRVIPMQGRNYVDCAEERIGISKVLDDSENYEVVINAVEPILNNKPSSLLYIVSKTDLISAKILADKVSYKSQILHQEANVFNNSPIIDMAPELNPENCKAISFDVIGAAIKKPFAENSTAPLNMFNKQLGDIYNNQVPPIFYGYELSMENMLKLGILLAILIIGTAIGVGIALGNARKVHESKIANFENEIASIDKFLEENKDVSSQTFSETDEIRMGLTSNKNIYSYYTIVGTEIPQKLWLTSLSIGNHVSITGQADNLESIYGFFRNIKTYDLNSGIKLQRLGLAGNSKQLSEINGDGLDSESVLTSLNADFYDFRISDVAEAKPVSEKASDNKSKDNNSKSLNGLPDLEPLE